jgi:hypothetical protein
VRFLLRNGNTKPQSQIDRRFRGANAGQYALQSAPFGELGGAILAAFKVTGDGMHRGP